jgi:hypothetical protein
MGLTLRQLQADESLAAANAESAGRILTRLSTIMASACSGILSSSLLNPPTVRLASVGGQLSLETVFVTVAV